MKKLKFAGFINMLVYFALTLVSVACILVWVNSKFDFLPDGPISNFLFSADLIVFSPVFSLMSSLDFIPFDMYAYVELGVYILFFIFSFLMFVDSINMMKNTLDRKGRNGFFAFLSLITLLVIAFAGYINMRLEFDLIGYVINFAVAGLMLLMFFVTVSGNRESY